MGGLMYYVMLSTLQVFNKYFLSGCSTYFHIS